MKNKSGDHNDFLNLLVYRSIINLSKSFLVTLEEFETDGIINQEYYQKQRKKILSEANDKIREFQETLERFKVELRK